ncbi:MAG: hypothetical protein WBN89_04045 [Prochlorococcaceae cyanobacterium]
MSLVPVDGEPLQRSCTVVRLAMPTSEGAVALPIHFQLSSEDKASKLKSISVWEESLTPATVARTLMNDTENAYTLGLSMSVDAIKDLSVVIEEDPVRKVISLDVVWDRDCRGGAEGHAGITGLHRQPGHPKLQYKMMRSKLAAIARPFYL